MWITCGKGAVALCGQGLQDTDCFLTSASMGSAALECASFPQPAAHHARSQPRPLSPRCRHRWRPCRPDGRRSTGPRGPGGRGVRCHAFRGPQVPAGGCWRHEHHPLRALPGLVARYAGRQGEIDALLRDFDADALRQWIHGLGIETFVGTSGRVFPTDMKAAPLLRAWLKRLRDAG